MLITTFLHSAENLRGVDVPVSEASFDNMFTNMLIRKLLDLKELKMDVYVQT